MFYNFVRTNNNPEFETFTAEFEGQTADIVLKRLGYVDVENSRIPVVVVRDIPCTSIQAMAEGVLDELFIDSKNNKARAIITVTEDSENLDDKCLTAIMAHECGHFLDFYKDANCAREVLECAQSKYAINGDLGIVFDNAAEITADNIAMELVPGIDTVATLMAILDNVIERSCKEAAEIFAPRVINLRNAVTRIASETGVSEEELATICAAKKDAFAGLNP